MQEVFENIIEEINNRIKTQIKIMAGLADETYRYGFGKSLEAYEQSKLIVEQAAAEDNNGWIPCSERLPKEYGDYLCCDKYGEYIIGFPIERISAEKSFYIETEHEIMNDCIAWQPLPKPYRKENNHEE